MEDFKALAVRYMGSDEEPQRIELASRAAQEIQRSGANRATVLAWVESVRQWIGGQGDEDMDLIARAKALRFLSDTLTALQDDALSAAQVDLLVAFFNAQLDMGEKVGILEAMTALEKLSHQSRCRSEQRLAIFEAISRLGDDFNKQTPVTRLRVYEVLSALVQDTQLVPRIQDKLGEQPRLIPDLLEVFHLEKDPQNLISWFTIQQSIIRNFSLSAETLQQVFDSFSAFFPISLRRPNEAGPVTVDDLKLALRGCFAAHGKLANLAFPFLLNKLDQGDALTVSVKVDVLKTLQACAESYENPAKNLVPFIPKIWASLKFEVRNGEAEEAIAATLQLLQTIAKSLDQNSGSTRDLSVCKDFFNLVFNDVKADLSNPTYCQAAARILTSIAGASQGVFAMAAYEILDHISTTLSNEGPGLTNALLNMANSMLEIRLALFGNNEDATDVDSEQGVIIRNTPYFDDLYKPTLDDIRGVQELSSQQLENLALVFKGIQLLIRQPPATDGTTHILACGEDVCEQMIDELCTYYLSEQATNPANGGNEPYMKMLHAAKCTLQAIIMQYPRLWEVTVEKVLSLVAAAPERTGVVEHRETLARLAAAGCEILPEHEPCSRFSFLVSKLLNFVMTRLRDGSWDMKSAATVSGIHFAVNEFEAACHRASAQSHRPLLGYKIDPATFKLNAWKIEVAEGGNPDEHTIEDVYTTYLQTSYNAVRILYRLVVKKVQPTLVGLQGSHVVLQQPTPPDGVLMAISGLTREVLRQLDAETQIALKLDQQLFALFVADQTNLNARLPEGIGGLGILLMGIIQGLRPEALEKWIMTSDTAYSILTQLPTADWYEREANGPGPDILWAIQMNMANKYGRRGQPLPGPSVPSISSILGFWEMMVRKGVLDKPNPVPARAISILNGMTSVASGFLARQDPSVKRLAPMFNELLGLLGRHGIEDKAQATIADHAARAMCSMIKDAEDLRKKYGCVVAPLYRQFAYVVFARPLVQSLLARDEDSDTVSYPRQYLDRNRRIAVLGMVAAFPFATYADDADSIVRVLLGSLLADCNLRPTDALNGLATLRLMLQEVPAKVQEHLESVVTLCRGTCEQHLPDTDQPEKGVVAGQSCLLAVEMLRDLPLGLDQTRASSVLKHVIETLNMAGMSSIRELREVTVVARQNWPTP